MRNIGSERFREKQILKREAPNSNYDSFVDPVRLTAFRNLADKPTTTDLLGSYENRLRRRFERALS